MPAYFLLFLFFTLAPTAEAAAETKPWAAVESLLQEQKYQAALDGTMAILQRARREHNDRLLTEALVKATQIEIGLHGYETAVRFLKGTDWPKDPSERVLLHLYYGQALMRYQQVYGWEIGQREKIATSGKTDLQDWTTEQIGQEISRSFDGAMAMASELGKPVPDYFRAYLSANNYPVGVRPLLRDAVVYLAAQHFLNQQFWSARQANGLDRLDLAELAAAKLTQRVPAADVKAHPLRKLASWLGELRHQHAQAGRTEAALEAHYSLLEALHSSFPKSADRAQVRAALRKLQANTQPKTSWWARGQALLATFLQQQGQEGEEGAERFLQARAEAQAGLEAFPQSVGGQMCRAIVFEIERPELSLQSMASDAAAKRSVLVTYRNLTKLHFRAYAQDAEATLRQTYHQSFSYVDGSTALQILRSGAQPVASWSSELPPTRDFALHKTFVTPPPLPPGTYVIVASFQEDFSEFKNHVQALRTIVSDLVLTARHDGSAVVDARVFSGETGLPLAGARVSLYQFAWNATPQEARIQGTDAQGYAQFTQPFQIPLIAKNLSYFLVARYKGQIALLDQNIWFGTERPEEAILSALVYTDRSVYRPQQKLFYKIVAYSGKPSEGKFQTAQPGQLMRVKLLDPHGQVATETQVKLGEFGTGSGEFLIPKGRPLGKWSLQTEIYTGSSVVLVEEYKRPTFEATFREAATALRLNRPAQLQGEAHYYFGLPVVGGNVSWRVTRSAVAPWWWGEWGWWQQGANRGAETIASGTAPLKADGSFAISFVPNADEREAKSGLSYNFQVEAEITDEGGETRSASRTYRLGFVAVEARLEPEQGFFQAGKAGKVRAQLANLDGKPLRGQGSYRLVRLESPPVALPAELPIAPTKNINPIYATPGDSQRARWETDFRWEAVTQSWKEAETIAEGRVDHDEKGEGSILWKVPPQPGIYRMIYETKDAFGATFRASRDLVVGGEPASNSTSIALPLLALLEQPSTKVGATARVLVQSGLANQMLTVEVYRAGKRISSRTVTSGKDSSLLEFPVTPDDRGGFTLLVTGLRDHQSLRQELHVNVPWSDRELALEFALFRDKLRPGQKETLRVSVKDEQGKPLPPATAELLAYMYDKSLDLFALHQPPSVTALYPSRRGGPGEQLTLGISRGSSVLYNLPQAPTVPGLAADQLLLLENYGIGGPSRRGGLRHYPSELAYSSMRAEGPSNGNDASLSETAQAAAAPSPSMSSPKQDKAGSSASAVPLRTNFSETAFFQPHLVFAANGQAAVEFTVPDSLTSWRVLAHAVTRDLRGGSVARESRSVKELMVRPYLPRFLREGDAAEIKVTVNNAAESSLAGTLRLEIENLDTGKEASADFQLQETKKTFQVPKGGSVTLSFPLHAPRKVGNFAFRTTASTSAFSDGELRPLPLLPSRLHLAQSRFVTLHQKDRKVLEFKDLASAKDPSLQNEQMVVTVDAQLFYGVLQALPYLVKYPYECVEQTLNRFLSAGIVTSVFGKYPAVAKMAQELSARTTELERFDDQDPNRRMGLEETPWLQAAQGGKPPGNELANILDAKVAKAERAAALAQLQKLQLPSGAFPWFAGGPPDKYMTLYVLLGLSRALEFQVDVPKETVARAWNYIHSWLEPELSRMIARHCCAEMITMVHFALSSYPDDSWTGNRFNASYRQRLLDYSFQHWKTQSPLGKGYLALGLQRAQRPADAKKVWDSVMDSAKHNEEQGTFWAREDRSWLWYNDEIESHAFSLRVQMELDQKNKHNEGLVQWLFLQKKLNHWKSTRATAEVIYALVHYLNKTAELGVREAVSVNLGGQKTEFAFDPEKYTGQKNQVVVKGEQINPQKMARIEVSKETPGLAFASATWHFSTEQLPPEARSDFFSVSRRFFRRLPSSAGWRLEPLAEGARIKVGDQIEVQLSLKTKHEAEYVHLRDPRGAGFEPETLQSGYKWNLGISWYEETRDSGANFFFSSLPVGEYTLKYRLRANMPGSFRVGPAEVQSIYAPDFNAYSTGAVLRVE